VDIALVTPFDSFPRKSDPRRPKSRPEVADFA
jgi:hypothetical protein